MMSDDSKHEARTKADALKILKAAKVNARFYIHATCDAQLPDMPDKYLPGAFRACVQVSRATAERFVEDAFSSRLEERGAALPVRVSVGARRERWNETAGAFVPYGEPRMFIYIG